MRDSIKYVLKKRCLGVILTSLLIVPSAATFARSGADELTSNSEDQKSVALTIYNVNLGLVRDRRDIQLPGGETSLKFAGVASQINPATVHIRSLTKPNELSVVEQNYEYDLLSP